MQCGVKSKHVMQAMLHIQISIDPYQTHLDNEALGVEKPAFSACFIFTYSFFDQCVNYQIGNTNGSLEYGQYTHIHNYIHTYLSGTEEQI